MKVLLVGVFNVDWSTNCSMQRALQKLGHQVTPFDYRAVEKDFALKQWPPFADKWIDKAASFLRSGRSPMNLDWYYRRKGRKEMNACLLDAVRKSSCDLVIFCKTDTVNYNLLPEINRHVPTWYYFMDPLDQVLRINASAYAKNATWASATFSDVARHFKRDGANVRWITEGVDIDIFKPCQRHKIYNVVFVGSKTHKRACYVESIKCAGIDIKCFGEGWENLPIYNEKLAEIYQSSRIVLNFCREGDGFSNRVLEVLATGSLLLSEHCLDLEHFFKPARHLDWFKNKSEVVAKIRHYLADETLCQQIACCGEELVRDKFSWEKTMNKIVCITKGERPLV